MPLTLEQSISQPFLVSFTSHSAKPAHRRHRPLSKNSTGCALRFIYPLGILCSKFVRCTNAEQRIESGELFNQNCAGF